jgi:hypothetical protein
MNFDKQTTANKLLNAQISILQSVLENESLCANFEIKKLKETEENILKLKNEQDKLHLFMTMSYGEHLNQFFNQLENVQSELTSNLMKRTELKKHHSLLMFEICWIENEIKDLMNKLHKNSNSK